MKKPKPRKGKAAAAAVPVISDGVGGLKRTTSGFVWGRDLRDTYNALRSLCIEIDENGRSLLEHNELLDLASQLERLAKRCRHGAAIMILDEIPKRKRQRIIGDGRASVLN